MSNKWSQRYAFCLNLIKDLMCLCLRNQVWSSMQKQDLGNWVVFDISKLIRNDCTKHFSFEVLCKSPVVLILLFKWFEGCIFHCSFSLGQLLRNWILPVQIITCWLLFNWFYYPSMQRTKIIADLLISVSKAERQEARLKVRQDSLRLGNVGVTRYILLFRCL